jgi:hypothetical protein
VVRLVQAGGSLELPGLIAQPYFLARSPGHVDENCVCLLSLGLRSNPVDYICQLVD